MRNAYGANRLNDEWSLGFLFHCTPADALEERILLALEGWTFICSPDGRVLRFDIARIVDLMIDSVVTLTDLNAVASGSPELGGVPDHFEHTFQLAGVDREAFRGQLMKDPDTPIPDLAEDWGILSRHQRVPMFYERVGYTICLEAYDLLARTDLMEPAQFRRTASVLRPFEGWSLCVEEDFALRHWAEVFAESLKSLPHGSQVNWQEGAAFGRPATMRTKTRAAYERLYPHGHGALAWLEVLRVVNRSTGLDASVDTLKRAIAVSSSTQKSD